jgi:hypothetical protein
MQDRSPPTRQNPLATHGRTIHRVTFRPWTASCMPGHAGSGQPRPDVRAIKTRWNGRRHSRLWTDRTAAANRYKTARSFRSNSPQLGHFGGISGDPSQLCRTTRASSARSQLARDSLGQHWCTTITLRWSERGGSWVHAQNCSTPSFVYVADDVWISHTIVFSLHNQERHSKQAFGRAL